VMLSRILDSACPSTLKECKISLEDGDTALLKRILAFPNLTSLVLTPPNRTQIGHLLAELFALLSARTNPLYLEIQVASVQDDARFGSHHLVLPGGSSSVADFLALVPRCIRTCTLIACHLDDAPVVPFVREAVRGDAALLSCCVRDGEGVEKERMIYSAFAEKGCPWSWYDAAPLVAEIKG
jgi:hypothetical protein